MIKDNVEKALNDQIQYEFTAAYAYLAMSAYFEGQNLSGFASWMLQQAKEEVEHAMKLFAYVNDRGGQVVLGAVREPKAGYKSASEVAQASLAMEQANTQAINKLYALAVKENDYATQTMLHWFINEQVEEEKTMREVIGLLEMAGDNRGAMLVLNGRMAQRSGG